MNSKTTNTDWPNAHNAPDSNPKWRSLLEFSWRRKVPSILQAEASECGIACLCMISQYYKKHIALRQLRIAMSASQQGLNLQHLMEYAAQLQFSTRALKLELAELCALKTPSILHWDFSHFVVLTKVTKAYVYINNPAIGEQKLTWNEVSQHFTGVALELTPKQNFQTTQVKKGLRIWDFAKGIQGVKRNIALLLALSLVIQLFVLASPFYMQTVIDKVLLTQSSSLLMVLALGFGLLLCIETFTQWLREIVVLRFSHLFNMHISGSVLAHLLSLPLVFFQRRHMGDIVSRFGSLQPVRDTLTQGLVSAILDGVLSLSTLLVIFIYSPKLGFVVLAIVAIYSLCRWTLFYPVKQLNQQILQAEAQEQSYFMQSIRAARTIKLANTSANTQSKWLDYFAKSSNYRIRLGQWNISFSIINKLLFGIENLLVVYLAAGLVMANQFTIGMLFAFMSYKSRFVGSTASLIEKWIEYKLLHVHLQRLEEIVYHAPEIPITNNEQAQFAGNQATTYPALLSKKTSNGANVKLDSISFSYHENQAVLFKNINLHISSGDTIAIIGASGCGKTSLLHCLLGLVAPTDGTISINNLPLLPANRHCFNIAAVMQDDQLLNGSVLDNISQFAEHVNIDRVAEAAKLACIDTDIMAMTMQYQTLIGDMGDSLSGGQKQRILLARALYQKPDLLILDEATSHLDIAIEAKVCANLKDISSTIVMVAHRPQTISTADKVFTLQSNCLKQVDYK